MWQERFASFPMDENYLLAAARYVEMNPVRAGMVHAPEDFRWSSAQAHLEGQDEGVEGVVGTVYGTLVAGRETTATRTVSGGNFGDRIY